ncbi:MAG: phage portal protein [Alphaproteobacteria bacterium]|nr:phage portal protein [Alphaproteobacteria bacterium]
MKSWFKKIATDLLEGSEVKKSRVSPLIAYSSLGSPVWTPKRYDRLAEEGFAKNVIVYRAVNLIARGAASVPWRLHEGDEEIFDHPILDLLHHPSPTQGGAAFIEAVLAYKLLAGNSYIEAVRGENGWPVELYPLRPDRIKIVPGNAGVPSAYTYSVGSLSKTIHVNGISGEADILHLKCFHPLNDWYGLSPIETAATAIDQHNAVSSHNLSLLQNGGRPSGALKIRTDNHMTDHQMNMLRDEVKSVYAGALNAGRLMVLQGDFEWQEIGLSPKDLDFIAGKNLSAREIAQAYGVPPMLVGVPGDATFANYREARYHLWEDTIIPLLDHLCDEFNHWLLPKFNERGMRLSFDMESIPALAPRREKTWKQISNVSFLTINEKRRALGYPALEDGDCLEGGINGK